jgi:iron complex outermembrane receptor protein
LPGASAGGAGTINRLNGTGWYTLDAKGVWSGWQKHALSFGAHRDAETFSQVKYNAADWRTGAPISVNTQARGRTATDALWLQDIWTITSDLHATLGLRGEQWRAYDGLNLSASPALNAIQPHISASALSPKASFAWNADENWMLTASWGTAYRMPTVTELYQAITTGTQLTVPDPNLKPEHDNSSELAAEYKKTDGRMRLSLFREDISNALLSQSAPLVPGSSTLFSYVQNVDRTRAQGAELVVDQNNAFLEGLELSGSVTYVIGKTVKDTVFPAAVNKFIPQLPKLRAEGVATWRPDDAWAFTLAARYSDRSFGTIDNSDPVSQTFQGFGNYLVADARVHYQWDENWSLSAGIDNLNNDKYFLFHPFPQRSFVMEIHYAQ